MGIPAETCHAEPEPIVRRNAKAVREVAGLGQLAYPRSLTEAL